MKQAVLPAAISLAAAVLAPSASAQLYVGAGYNVFTVDKSVANFTFDFNAFTGRVGYKFTPFFGIEGEYSAGQEDKSYWGGPFSPSLPAPPVQDTTISFDNTAGVFAVGFAPLSPIVSAFGRAGYTHVSVETSGFSPPKPLDEGNAAFGAGVQVDVLAFKLRAEFARYADGDVRSLGISGLVQF